MKLNLGRRLGEGVGAWLRFEELCGRQELFSERYMAGAIGQVLAHLHRVTPEYPHPVLAPLREGPGRKPSLDFVCRNHRSDTLQVALETKWIGKTALSFSDIFWDVVRLGLIAYHHGGAEAYFLLGGKKRDLTELLGRAEFSPNSITGQRKFLLRIGTRVLNTVPLRGQVPAWVHLADDLLAPYAGRGLTVPNEVLTQCMSVHPPDSTATQFQIVVWRITATPNIQFFRV